MPGDNNLFGTRRGDNNRQIIGRGGVVGNNWGGEFAKFWADLFYTGFLNSNGSLYPDCSNYCDIMSATSTQIPRSAYDKNLFTIPVGSTPGTNYYLTGIPYTGNAGAEVRFNPGFEPSAAAAIDSKLDDNNPSAGNVIATDILNHAYLVIGSGGAISAFDTIGTNCTTSAGGAIY